MLLPIGAPMRWCKEIAASAWRLQVRPSLVAQPGASRNLRPCTERSRHVGQALAVREKSRKSAFDKLRASGFPSEPFVLSLSKTLFFPGLLALAVRTGGQVFRLCVRRAQATLDTNRYIGPSRSGRVGCGSP